jgi:hypothetical protein
LFNLSEIFWILFQKEKERLLKEELDLLAKKKLSKTLVHLLVHQLQEKELDKLKTLV